MARLWRVISAEDLDRLVRTQGFWSITGSSFTDAAVMLVDRELEQRIAAFEETATALEDLVRRWSYGGVFVVADTSVYINAPDKLEALDFHGLLDLRPMAVVHLLIPIVVIDELDALKKDGKRHVRWRARHSLAVLDDAFRAGQSTATLRPERSFADSEASGGLPYGAVQAEVVFDPPQHVRLPINDDELIDRALVIDSLAKSRVLLVTYDTGQAMRARTVGIDVRKLSDPPEGPEPQKP